MVLAYLLGRTLDYADSLPLSLALVPLILAMPAGAAFLHADTAWLAVAAASIVAAGATIVAASAMHSGGRLRTGTSNFNPSLDDQAQIGSGIPADVQELARRAENPAYQRFPSFDRAWERMSDFLAGHCCHLGLFGSRGAGKTAAADALATRLAQELEKRGSPPALLLRKLPPADRRAHFVCSFPPGACPALRSEPAGASGAQDAADQPGAGRAFRVGYSFCADSVSPCGGRRRCRGPAG